MVIVIALLLDEVIQEVAIFCTDVLSQGQGTRRALSLSDPISSWPHGKGHVAHKSENRSYKEEFMPRFHQRKRHCAKEENKRALKRDVFVSRIAHRSCSCPYHCQISY